jgi:hypothetical protein
MATPKNNLEKAEALRRKVGIEGQGLLDTENSQSSFQETA